MGSTPRRSTGVTAGATYVLLCCATTLLLWGYILLLLLNAPPDEQGRRLYELDPAKFLLFALVPPAVIAVAVRTAIGVLELRPWARVASMVWAAIALVVCLSIIAFRPFETFVIPQRFVRESVLTQQILALSIVLLFLPLSVWWLFYFRTENVKRQFQPQHSREDTAVTSSSETLR